MQGVLDVLMVQDGTPRGKGDVSSIGGKLVAYRQSLTTHFRIMRKFAPFENFPLYGIRDTTKLWEVIPVSPLLANLIFQFYVYICISIPAFLGCA